MQLEGLWRSGRGGGLTEPGPRAQGQDRQEAHTKLGACTGSGSSIGPLRIKTCVSRDLAVPLGATNPAPGQQELSDRARSTVHPSLLRCTHLPRHSGGHGAIRSVHPACGRSGQPPRLASGRSPQSPTTSRKSGLRELLRCPLGGRGGAEGPRLPGLPGKGGRCPPSPRGERRRARPLAAATCPVASWECAVAERQLAGINNPARRRGLWGTGDADRGLVALRPQGGPCSGRLLRGKVTARSGVAGLNPGGMGRSRSPASVRGGEARTQRPLTASTCSLPLSLRDLGFSAVNQALGAKQPATPGTLNPFPESQGLERGRRGVGTVGWSSPGTARGACRAGAAPGVRFAGFWGFRGSACI